MTSFFEHFYTAPDGIRTYYRVYPASGTRTGLPVLCMHGLTRNSRDFEAVAPRIASQGRTVIAVDVRGRGRSDYDPDPSRYTPATYVEDMIGILGQAGIEKVVALGTSMGGLMTMIMAAAHPRIVTAAAINDIGPVIDPKGLKRIEGYVGGGGPYDSWAEAAEAIRAINGVAFPTETGDDFWLDFARRVCREAEGKIVLDYDPAISQPVKGGNVAPPDLWPFFDALSPLPLLLVRGALTDLLAMETVEEMQRRSPHMQLVQVPNVGHAPLLTEPVAEAALDQFFQRVD
jgi:pimeloyl-ACP methyl ester carboxylesterase